MKLLLAGMLLVSAACTSLTARAPRQPEIFGAGTVSTIGHEFATSFAPDGATLYLSRPGGGRIDVMCCRAQEDSWSAQEKLPFSDGSYPIVDPFVSFDGERMYFSSSGPPAEGASPTGFDLWYVDREGTGWSGVPVRIDPASSPGSDVFCTLTRDGDLYFSSRAKGQPRVLMRAQRDGATWLTPEPIDVGLGAASVGNPLVAPDGSFLIFTAELPDGFGSADLYVCERAPGGGFGAARLLPEPLNSAWADYAPALSPDGRTFFFTSERPGMMAGEAEGRRPGDIYWVRLSALGL